MEINFESDKNITDGSAETTFDKNITDESAETTLGKSREALVYGFEHCFYDHIAWAIEKRVSKVFWWTIGDDVHTEQEGADETLATGRKIDKIDSGSKALMQGKESSEELEELDHILIKKASKAGLVNIILENYKRSLKESEPLIPIVFCIDKDENHTPLTSELLLSRSKKIFSYNYEIKKEEEKLANNLMTHSELRRAYKLCNDPRLDRAIREVAQKTFRFVKVVKVSSRGDLFTGLSVTYSLELINAPWDKPDFNQELEKRKETKKVGKDPKNTDWIAQANAVAKISQKSVLRYIYEWITGAPARKNLKTNFQILKNRNFLEINRPLYWNSLQHICSRSSIKNANIIDIPSAVLKFLFPCPKLCSNW